MFFLCVWEVFINSQPAIFCMISPTSSWINLTFIWFVLVSGSSSSYCGSEPVSPASPSAFSTISSPLSSPSSPVLILQPPIPVPPKTPYSHPPHPPHLPHPHPPYPPHPPTKTRTHSFCNHVTRRQLSSNCNLRHIYSLWSMVWRVTLVLGTLVWLFDFVIVYNIITPNMNLMLAKMTSMSIKPKTLFFNRIVSHSSCVQYIVNQAVNHMSF